MTDDMFVTVLQSNDPYYVDTVVAMLEGEGIHCQHTGKNHSALTGLRYLTIDLRVPTDRADDARALIAGMSESAATADAEGSSEKLVTFRVQRDHGWIGGVLGWVCAVGVFVVIRAVGRWLPQSGLMALLLGGAGVGYLWGVRQRRDRCSRPGCAGRLALDAKACPKCGAELKGVVRSEREHFAAEERLRARRERLQVTPNRELVPEGSRCAIHPELAALTLCPRCGSFACEDCSSGEGNGYCVRCEELRARA
jgi:hypothetical protein